MRRSSVCSLVVLAAAVLMLDVPAHAQAYHNPAVGSAERKAIMNALRVPVAKFLHQPVIFKVTFVRSQGGWALMEGIPETPSGAQIDWNKTQWAAAWKAGGWGGGVNALVREKNGKYTVVTYVVGATDVEYVDWPQKYGCPAAICHLGGGN